MYRIRLLKEVYEERKILPGNIRQRIKNLIESLAREPRPYNSVELTFRNY
jgi:mRNA-degrading endonuclease RelE of RelBE toxin-antitoxin system